MLLNSTEAEGAKLEPDGDAVITFQEPQKTDLTYDLCLASWAYWLVDTYAIEDDNDERYQDPDNEVGLFAGGVYDKEDDEADRIYREIDEKMDKRRRARRLVLFITPPIFPQLVHSSSRS